MRVHPWIASILSGLALLAGGQAGFAQQNEMESIPGGESAGIPLYSAGPAAPGAMGYPAPYGANPVVPPPPSAPSGAWDPIAAGQNGGPGYLPSQKPWPGISPFENRFAEHANEGGLWFLRRNNSARRYFANVDYRFAHYRRPTSTKVGSIIAPQTNTAAGIPTEFLPVDTGVLYDSFIGNFHGLPTSTGGTGTTTGGVATVDNVAVNEQHLQSRPAVNGFKIDWGFQEPTGNGMVFSGWYTPQAHWLYSRGFNATPQEIANRNEATLGKPLAITNALPLNDGLPNGINGTVDGTYVTYDRLFRLDYQSVAGGGDMNWLFTPFWKNDWFQFSPTGGLQFLYIGEEFSLNAADSGGSLTFNVPPGLEDPTSFAPAVTPFQSQIISKVNSFLFGPQIGLRFQVGGDNLKLVGHSNFGLAMNHERMELSSFGVGNALTNPAAFNQNARFHEKQEHTILSPITSHEVAFQAHVFQFIPGIRKIHFLSEANFRIGYQIQAAYNVQRPNRTVQYNGFPLIPAIRTDQETSWYVQSYNFGVNWNY